MMKHPKKQNKKQKKNKKTTKKPVDPSEGSGVDFFGSSGLVTQSDRNCCSGSDDFMVLDVYGHSKVTVAAEVDSPP